MKVLNKIILIIVILNTGLGNLYAQKNQVQRIKISGTLIDEENKINFGKVNLSYSESEWFKKYDRPEFSIPIATNGIFEFSLPDLNKPYRIAIIAFSKEGVKLWDGNFYVESKDNVILKIFFKKDSISCSGYGSEKYNLLSQIVRQKNKDYLFELGMVGKVKDTIELNDKMNKLFSLFQKYNAKKQRLIQDSKVNFKMKSILNQEYGVYENDWVFRTEILIRKNANYRKKIVDYYLNHNGDIFNKPDSLSKYCYRYWFYLSGIEAANLMYKSDLNKINIENFYNHIKNKYSGYTRDRLISTCFLTSSTKFYFARYAQSTSDSLLNDALTYVKVPYIKEALVDEAVLRVKSKIGTEIYNSEFIGLDGKSFNFKSLKGKVFLIDGWFNGCGFCASFHEFFEREIYPKFKNDSDFVVLSMNFDKTRDRWIKGIESKSYTSEDYLNVTTGSWFDHPFSKYYSIFGAPFLILVDADGNISYKPDSGAATKESIIDEINKALKRKSNNNPSDNSKSR